VLSPRNRTLLLESLRPPVGYRLDHAIGTSYSLDLLALLTAPLAFTFFDWEDKHGKPSEDPIALLESIRRNAARMHLFSQAGEIKLPKPENRLIAYLEDCVVPVQPPADRNGKRGIFHPKVWLMRFVAEGEPVRYRFLCSSRNLTFDRCWDTILSMDGELEERKNAHSHSKPLSEFIAALPGMAVQPMAPETSAKITQIAEEIPKVKFELSDDIDDFAFWPLGHDGRKQWPLKAYKRSNPMVVVSPFLSPSLLGRIGKDHGSLVLVSRADQLACVPADTLAGFQGVYALSDTAEDREEDREADQRTPLAGLHAKIFVEDDGWNARMFVGSANATNAAFERNVEFMVELYGKKKLLGIETFLGAEGTKEGIRPLLAPWKAGDITIPEEQVITQKLDAELAELRRLLAGQSLSLHCIAGEAASQYLVELRSESTLPEQLVGRCSFWLSSQHANTAKAGEGNKGVLARLGPVGAAALTGFLACSMAASEKGITRETRFVLNLPVEGLPLDRLDKLLASQIQDRSRLMRLMLLLLQQEAGAADFAESFLANEGKYADASRAAGTSPLFELLVRATVDGKQRIADIGRLLDDLARTEEGRKLVPPELTELWIEMSKLQKEEDGQPRPA
jgi:hypothetical protein